ncbi:aromatic amino acid transferase [Lactobacillus acidophilus DSM 20079 = JCM 1132 = NBRC 13951 = CIP 76.13]|nr:aromatic amino acid transferase [Lactobacillus acidophilus DSM 20079 = JCM 1132 = NBRC 13951 = CIP 76.13]
MTGWRLGYIAGPKQIMKAIRKVNSFLITSVTDNVQMAAVEALNNGQNDPKEARKIYESRLRFMQTGLEKLGFEMATPQGAFYIFAKIPEKYGTDDENFAFELAQKAKVGVTPGRYFGKGGEGYVRLSYASSTEQLRESLQRITNFVDNL